MSIEGKLKETLGPDAGPTNEGAPSQRVWVLPLAACLCLAATLFLYQEFGPRFALLFAIGLALGLTLFHAAFGFASSWRRFLLAGDGHGMRAQIVMLALTSLVFFPILAEGHFFDRAVIGAVAPAGLSVAFGAFLFGIGMQLAGGCASGTLYTAGGGSMRMMVVLVFFMVGSLAGAAHLPFWLDVARGERFSLVSHFGAGGGLGIQLAILAAIFWGTYLLERLRKAKTPSSSASLKEGGKGLSRILRGPWPLLVGAAALALLNVATMATAGHPWTISFGYTLWGAKIAGAVGWDVSSWTFWSWPFPKKALAGSIFENTTSVMNFGIFFGAFLAAGLAGRFKPSLRALDPRSEGRRLFAAVLGGLLMGYGARLAFGCNVGAYFSGIASGSLHGWLWLASALAGTYFGAKLRPRFALSRL